MRNKLVTESIAPWRTVRLFFYFAFGSGALIGGIITLTGFVAALTSANEDLNVNTEVRQAMLSSDDAALSPLSTFF